jgi:hypothetical protein
VLADSEKSAQAILKYCNRSHALVDDRDKHGHLWEAAGGPFIHYKDARSSIDALADHGFDARLT